MIDREPDATVRASSWGELMDCSHRFEGAHILGLRKPSSAAAALGTAIHKGTAAFDLERMRGSPISVDDAVGVMVDSLANPKDEVVWDEPKRDMERVGITLVTDYSRNWSPKFNFVGVEMETTPLDVAVDGYVIRLTGTMDRARAHDTPDGGTGIDDVKSGKRAVNADGVADTKAFGAQLGVYELLYEHSSGREVTEPANIIGMRTSGKPIIGLGQIHNAKQMMIGKPGSPGMLEMGALMLKSGLFPPNPRSALCGEKYCARWSTCRFHD